jgi:hypothetical protein
LTSNIDSEEPSNYTSARMSRNWPCHEFCKCRKSGEDDDEDQMTLYIDVIVRKIPNTCSREMFWFLRIYLTITRIAIKHYTCSA